MKQILSEKNIVVILFVMVLITFSLAQEDSKKMEKMYSGATNITASSLLSLPSEINKSASKAMHSTSVPE
ncbi:MAG: hypothetical protein ABIU11_04775 [Chitinophagaceae bacterium]